MAFVEDVIPVLFLLLALLLTRPESHFLSLNLRSPHISLSVSPPTLCTSTGHHEHHLVVAKLVERRLYNKGKERIFMDGKHFTPSTYSKKIFLKREGNIAFILCNSLELKQLLEIIGRELLAIRKAFLTLVILTLTNLLAVFPVVAAEYVDVTSL